MNDRELLELAAKAAGIKHPGGEHCINGPAVWDCEALRWWRPLTDDGDALRLATALRLTIYHDDLAVIIKHKRYSWEWMGEMIDEDKGDRVVATRRAIVRAAAAIGRAM